MAGSVWLSITTAGAVLDSCVSRIGGKSSDVRKVIWVGDASERLFFGNGVVCVGILALERLGGRIHRAASIFFLREATSHVPRQGGGNLTNATSQRPEALDFADRALKAQNCLAISSDIDTSHSSGNWAQLHMSSIYPTLRYTPDLREILRMLCRPKNKPPFSRPLPRSSEANLCIEAISIGRRLEHQPNVKIFLYILSPSTMKRKDWHHPHFDFSSVYPSASNQS